MLNLINKIFSLNTNPLLDKKILFVTNNVKSN